MAKKTKINYDKEYDILWVYTGEKVKDSLEIDNFVIDFSHENKVVGVEIMDASKILKKLSLLNINKKILSNIISSSISFHQSRDFLYIVIGLVVKIDNKIREIPIQVPAPAIAVSTRF